MKLYYIEYKFEIPFARGNTWGIEAHEYDLFALETPYGVYIMGEGDLYGKREMEPLYRNMEHLKSTIEGRSIGLKYLNMVELEA